MNGSAFTHPAKTNKHDVSHTTKKSIQILNIEDSTISSQIMPNLSVSPLSPNPSISGGKETCFFGLHPPTWVLGHRFGLHLFGPRKPEKKNNNLHFPLLLNRGVAQLQHITCYLVGAQPPPFCSFARHLEGKMIIYVYIERFKYIYNSIYITIYICITHLLFTKHSPFLQLPATCPPITNPTV